MESTLDRPLAGKPALSPGFSNGEAEVYRSVSRTAVASLLLGVLGLTAFGTPFLTVIPLVGLAFAVLAFLAFRKFPEELMGKPLAITGAVFCTLTVIAAPAWHAYVYATEVPEGYERVNFSTLMSDKNQPDLPPIDAIKLNGKQVFIKGYIHPTSMDSMTAKKFVIVPDLGTCCFGGQPPLTHMVEVTLLGEEFARKSMRKQKLAGTLRVNPSLKKLEGLTGVYYQLRADILK